MKKLMKISLICSLAFGIGVGITVLAADSIYRADLRNCVHSGESKINCEAKFK